jgi:hypothetical protein
MQNLPRLYRIRKEPILDPGAIMHLLEVITKTELGQSAVWLLNTLMEGL